MSRPAQRTVRRQQGPNQVVVTVGTRKLTLSLANHSNVVILNLAHFRLHTMPRKMRVA